VTTETQQQLQDRYLRAREDLQAVWRAAPSIHGDWIFGDGDLFTDYRTYGREGVRIRWGCLQNPPGLTDANAVEILVPGRFFGNWWPSWEIYGTVAEALAEPRLAERLLVEMYHAIAAAEAWVERSARTLEAERRDKAARFERALAPRRGWIRDFPGPRG